MAIVRGEDGRFFDVDDAQLEKNEIKPEDLPEGSIYARPAGGGAPPGGGGGGPTQLVMNIGGGGGSPAPGGAAPDGGGKDVQAHGNCGWTNWYNWRNCGWRNYCA